MTPFTCEHRNPVRPGEAFSEDQCRGCWLKARAGWPVQKGTPLRARCLHLGKRTEFKAGCGGWRCVHECEAGEPQAVPGGNCQTCPKWEGE